MKVNINRTLRKQQNAAVLQFNKNYVIAVTAMFMWAAHVVFGCKKRKLRQLFEMIVKLNRELEKRYQFDAAEDEEWLYKRLLKRDLDIDIEEWWNEPKEDWQ
jgi:hypothetical protein